MPRTGKNWNSSHSNRREKSQEIFHMRSVDKRPDSSRSQCRRSEAKQSLGSSRSAAPDSTELTPFLPPSCLRSGYPDGSPPRKWRFGRMGSGRPLPRTVSAHLTKDPKCGGRTSRLAPPKRNRGGWPPPRHQLLSFQRNVAACFQHPGRGFKSPSPPFGGEGGVRGFADSNFPHPDPLRGRGDDTRPARGPELPFRVSCRCGWGTAERWSTPTTR